MLVIEKYEEQARGRAGGTRAQPPPRGEFWKLIQLKNNESKLFVTLKKG